MSFSEEGPHQGWLLILASQSKQTWSDTEHWTHSLHSPKPSNQVLWNFHANCSPETLCCCLFLVRFRIHLCCLQAAASQVYLTTTRIWPTTAYPSCANHMYPSPFWIQGPWKENSRPGECNNPSPPAARTASSLGKPNLVSILMPGEAKWGITKLPSPRDRHHFLMRGFTSCASLRGLFNFIFKHLQQTGDAGLTTKCKV